MKSSASKKPSAKKVERRQEVTFDANVLIARLREHAETVEGKRKLTMRTTTFRLANPAPVLRSRDICAIRIKLGVSQPVFASILNVPVATARSWEQGTRSPSGAALRLLELVRRQPKVVVSEVAPSLAKAVAA
ncbi:MAG: transcriptional regulator [Chthoniobacterales bacterium]|nr:transcriptional regulator [Chthoniobacterales bacterium]